MTEYDGYNKQNRRAEFSDYATFEVESRKNRTLTSPDLDPTPAQSSASECLTTFQLKADSFELFTQEFNGFNNMFKAKPKADFEGILALEIQGKPMQRIFSYLATDRLALVARLKTVDKVPLANMISIFVGNYYKEVVQSTEKGIAYGYLQPDNYYNTLVISPNGIVYQEIERSQDAVGTYDITLGRVTKANATFRQPHRKFI